jgi:hypothetical protein
MFLVNLQNKTSQSFAFGSDRSVMRLSPKRHYGGERKAGSFLESLAQELQADLFSYLSTNRAAGLELLTDATF